MKKIIIFLLTSTLFIGNLSLAGFAYVPTDETCMDFSKLSQEKEHVHINQVCGCKTCEADAYTFPRLEFLIDEMKYEASKEVLTSRREMENMKDVLKELEIALKNKKWKYGNYLLIVKNNDPCKYGMDVEFQKKEGLNYEKEYGEEFFEKDIKDKANEVLNIVENRKPEWEKIQNKAQPRLSSESIILISVLAAVAIGISAVLTVYYKCPKLKEKISSIKIFKKNIKENKKINSGIILSSFKK